MGLAVEESVERVEAALGRPVVLRPGGDGVERRRPVRLLPGRGRHGHACSEVGDLEGGAWDPEEGYVDPYSVTMGLAAGARKYGGKIRRNTRVDLTEFRAKQATPADAEGLQTATLGGGCFWCVEAVLERIRGVASVESGFAGGSVENPSYRQITSGKTGHAECVQVRFDPR